MIVLQYLIQHLTMLTSHTYYRIEILWVILELFHQRTHLYRLRSSSKD